MASTSSFGGKMPSSFMKWGKQKSLKFVSKNPTGAQVSGAGEQSPPSAESSCRKSTTEKPNEAITSNPEPTPMEYAMEKQPETRTCDPEPAPMEEAVKEQPEKKKKRKNKSKKKMNSSDRQPVTENLVDPAWNGDRRPVREKKTVNMGVPSTNHGDQRPVPEKKTLNVMVSLTKEEIEEDFMKMLGRKPARRPKRRPRAVREELDVMFPGLNLTNITADKYDVPKAD